MPTDRLGDGSRLILEQALATYIVGAPTDRIEAARRLYRLLRQAQAIAVVSPPARQPLEPLRPEV
jgi:hypothetical protein